MGSKGCLIVLFKGTKEPNEFLINEPLGQITNLIFGNDMMNKFSLS